MEKEKDDIIENRYNILSKLDSGGFAVVYIVTDNQENNGKQYAAKIYNNLKDVDKEIEILKILKDLHNPFLINFINEGKGLIKYKGKIFKDKKYCILELASKYNLFKYIESTGKFKETH
jgi:serine/threonine protein kinase